MREAYDRRYIGRQKGYSTLTQRTFKSMKYYNDDTGDFEGFVKFMTNGRFTDIGSVIPYKVFNTIKKKVLPTTSKRGITTFS